MKQINSENSVLQIPDENFLNIIFMELSAVLILFFYFIIFQMESSSILLNKSLGISLMVLASFRVVYRMYHFFIKQSYYLKLDENCIYSSYDKRVVELNKDIEILKLNPLWALPYNRKRVKRLGIFGRAVLLLIYPLLFCLTIPTFLFMSWYKQSFAMKYLLVLIPKEEDKEIVTIYVSPDEVEQYNMISAYLYKSLSVKINDLKPFWFIPQKG